MLLYTIHGGFVSKGNGSIGISRGSHVGCVFWGGRTEVKLLETRPELPWMDPVLWRPKSRVVLEEAV